MKKKITIVSADDILPYQPSILNLYDLLAEKFDVSIISFEPEYLGNQKTANRDVVYIQTPSKKRKFFRLFDLMVNAPLKRIDKYLFRFSYRLQLVRRYREKLLRAALRQVQADIFIAVDPMPLYAVQQEKGAAHFLSLEIIPGDPYFKKVRKDLILSVIIQNQYRSEYLFKKSTIKTFYIPNAPFLKDRVLNTGPREHLLWAGTVVEQFGIFRCFDFIKACPQYKLYCKGGVEQKTKKIIDEKYADLLKNGNVVIDDRYLSSEEFVKYLSRFKTGFCFYDLDLVKRNFNYATAPSGKLFMYLAAGVPVVACNIPAFKFIEEAGAGILIDDYTPETIRAAVQKIELDPGRYSRNCYRVFEENAFDRNAAGFIDFLSL